MPEPLSLMPGPSSTESRWPPTTIVRSLSPDLVSAVRLYSVTSVVVVDRLNVTFTAPAVYSASPTSLLTIATGMAVNGFAPIGSALLAIRVAPVVEHEHRRGAERLGQGDLVRERAGAALDQRDLAVQVLAGPVGLLAAVRACAGAPGGRQLGRSGGHDRRGHVPGAGELGDDVVAAADRRVALGVGRAALALQQRRAVLLPAGELERHALGLVARPLQPPLDVLQRCQVAGRCWPRGCRRLRWRAAGTCACAPACRRW